MFGDPREAAEEYLVGQLASMTTATGLPQPFRLVTRKLIHFNDIKPGQLPVCFFQVTPDEGSVRRVLSHVRDVRLPARIVVGFAPTTLLPESVANAYRVAIEAMIEDDLHLGGLVDGCYVTGELQAGLWEEVGLLAIGVLLELVYEYDPRLPAVTA